MKKETLWTKNFIIITLGTISSAIGGIAMNFAFSLVIFDQSQSTFLTGLFGSISMIPAIVVPLLIAPLLDNKPRKPMIVGIDFITGILYILFALYLCFSGFSYVGYVIFSLIISTTGSIYYLTYNSFYPNLIPKGFAQKGYAVSSLIYPTVTVFVTPVAAFLYSNMGIEFICVMEGMLLLISASLEHFIDVSEKQSKDKVMGWRDYLNDMKEGLYYLKEEKGLLKLYSYLPVTQGIGEGLISLQVAFFQSSPVLTTTMYSFFTVAEFIGRTIGGIVHYKFTIPKEKRFSLAVFVYYTYAFMDAVLLFIGYPFMLVNRCICGFLGINSATLRESSVQSYVPDEKRAKINALFLTVFSISGMFFRFLIGVLGELFAYPIAMAICAVINMVTCYIFVVRGKEEIAPIFNSDY